MIPLNPYDYKLEELSEILIVCKTQIFVVNNIKIINDIYKNNLKVNYTGIFCIIFEVILQLDWFEDFIVPMYKHIIDVYYSTYVIPKIYNITVLELVGIKYEDEDGENYLNFMIFLYLFINFKSMRITKKIKNKSEISINIKLGDLKENFITINVNNTKFFVKKNM